MTPTLIDQLKLAIQVESGEVPLSEVQWKHRGIKDGKWRATTFRPEEWNHKDYEYRRKPKPLECEVIVMNGRVVGVYGHIHTPIDATIIKMREVTNE